MYSDQRLDGYQVSHLMGFKLERCVLECFLVKLCVSFNYRDRLGVCELNKATVSEVGNHIVVNATGFGHHELQAWNEYHEMAGTCASRPCAENQRCVQTSPTHTCVDDGRIDNCKHISQCNPSYGDGHYWIKMDSGERSQAILYCHNMANDEPQTFITLPPGVNMATNMEDGVTGVTKTIYNKIRIDTDFNVNLTDTTFATSTGLGTHIPFGTAASCYGDGDVTPKTYSQFNIDTTGTGLAVSPNTTWISDPSNTTELVAFTRTGSTVTGSCWGHCGSSCHAEGDVVKLDWEYNPTDVVDGPEAILPVCV